MTAGAQRVYFYIIISHELIPLYWIKMSMPNRAEHKSGIMLNSGVMEALSQSLIPDLYPGFNLNSEQSHRQFQKAGYPTS